MLSNLQLIPPLSFFLVDIDLFVNVCIYLCVDVYVYVCMRIHEASIYSFISIILFPQLATLFLLLLLLLLLFSVTCALHCVSS